MSGTSITDGCTSTVRDNLNGGARTTRFTALGIEASEMMPSVQTAMLGGMPYTALRDAIFTHPTTAEGLVYLLASVQAQNLRQAA